MSTNKKLTRILVVIGLVAGLLSLPFITAARVNTVTINIVNNSNREIVHVYLSHVDQDDWGDNQLGLATIAPGQSYTLSNISWDNTQIKINAEDRDGCFLTHVSPSSGTYTWTLTSNDPVNCGGN